jgi:long-chain acyl-CoA synthetase
VVHFENALNAGAIIETVRQQRISVVVAVPRILDTLRQKLEQAADVASLVQSNEDTSFPRRVWRARSAHRRFGWKFWAFVSGGATLNPETEAFFHRLGFAVVQGYGMTETAALITVAHPFHIQKHSVGKVLPGREVKVTNGGEVLVRGDNVAAGVWNNGIQPVTDFDGWLHTGDLAQQDQSGNLFFRGRQKDVIVTSAGIKIYPEDIEAALNQQPEVKASVVIGLEGADGPEPVAVLILREHGCGAESIIDHANQKLGPLQQVRRWMIWPETEFPRTATQKIQKPAIGRWAESTLARQSAEPSSLSKSDLSTLAALISRITRTLPATTQPSSRLDLDFKLDSIGRVELLALLEDHYQIELDETSIATASTLGEIQKLVAQAGVCPIAESEGLSPIEDFQPSPKAEERRGTAAGSLDGLEPTERAAQPLAQAPYPYPRWALSKAVNAIRFCSHWPLLPLARVLCRVRVRGREQISQLGGPILIIANHVTYFDPGLILYTLPSHLGKQLVIAMDGDRLRRWRYPPMTLPPLSRFGWRLLYVLICGLVNVYSLPQTGAFRRSFRYAGEAMDRGYSVLIFPEGRLTADGNMNAFRPGIGLLAAGLGVSILPVRLDRLFELRQAWSERKWITPWDMQAQVTVSFGEPLQIRKDETPEAITRRLEQAVSALAETK